jgi:Skp family chaperone for outer membrane proteins
MIKKSLAELNEEAKISGESQKLPADLDNILKEMQEVLTNMQTERLDDKLVQNQEQILSKLLDAQRSINERDFEKKRKSNTGENLVRQSPSYINLSSDEGKEKLKDELNKAVQEGYAKDYEELILKYYEAIQTEDNRK